MSKVYFYMALLVASASVSASNYLTLVPTHTNGFDRNFNPYEATVGRFYAPDFIYEPLWVFNIWHPENDYPRLAESYVISDDLKSITYTLRDHVQWSDGQPFTAADVVFTYEYAKSHPNYKVNIEVYDPITRTGLVSGARALDAHTVTFDLANPNALAHQSIGRLYPLPKHIFSAIESPENFDNATPVGTGPFTEVAVFNTSQFRLCRNPYYYQDEQLKVDCLRFPNYSGNNQLWAAARRGKIDWMGEGIQNPEADFTQYSQNNKYWLAPSSNVNLQLNTTKAPFNNVSFRQALSIAIDRRHLRDIDTFGLTSKTLWPVGTGPLYDSWYDENALRPVQYLMEYSPEAAKKLLDDAGFMDKNGDGLRDLPNGDKFTVGVAVPSGWTDWVNSVYTIVNNFKAVGIDAKVEAMDEQKWYARIPTGDFDIYMMWTNPGITPWTNYSELFASKKMVEGKIDGQSMHQLKVPEIEVLLKAFTQTANSQKQHDIITKIQLLVAEKMPVISLFSNPTWYEYSDKKFTGWVTKENPYVRPQVHQNTPERLIHVLNLKPVSE